MLSRTYKQCLYLKGLGVMKEEHLLDVAEDDEQVIATILVEIAAVMKLELPYSTLH